MIERGSNLSATKSYNKKYYRDNRSELLADRRRRYQEDVEYRGRVKQQARLHYRRKHTTKEKQAVAVERKLFPISKLAKAIKRKVETVRDYHKKGILQDSYYRDSRGWRMYTRDQILALVQIFSAFDNPGNFELTSLQDVAKKIKEVW